MIIPPGHNWDQSWTVLYISKYLERDKTWIELYFCWFVLEYQLLQIALKMKDPSLPSDKIQKFPPTGEYRFKFIS